MISTWILYSVGVALLLGVAALAAERVCLATRRPTRWVWAAALVGSLLLPPLLARTPARGLFSGSGPAVAIVGQIATVTTMAESLAPPASTAPSPLERSLALAWLLGSALLGTAVFLSALHLERQRPTWRHHRLAGRGVWVTRRTGPAVVGFLWTEVVVPQWVLGWDLEAQRLLLAHEEEHERAGDPYLLLLSILGVILLPWNLPLWWQARRLRLAVEVDCDARVLRRQASVQTYGRLLMEVGRRVSTTLVPVAAFSRSPSLLKRRIRVLAGPGYRPRRSVLFTLWGSVLLAPLVAYGIPAPERPDFGQLWPEAPDAETRLLSDTGQSVPPEGDAQAGIAGEPTYTPFEVRPELRNRAELGRALAQRSSAIAAGEGVGGTVVLWAFIDEGGVVRNTRLVRGSGHAYLDWAAQDALRETARFTPARDGGRRVPAWIQVPVAFEARGRSADEREESYRVPLATTPPPNPPTREVALAELPSLTPYQVPPELLDRSAFGRLLAQSYPAEWKVGTGRTAVLWAYVDAAGVVRSTRLATSSGDEKVDLAAREALRQARFAPARHQGRPVDAWVQFPVTLPPR